MIGDGLAASEHSRPAGCGQRPATVPAEDEQGIAVYAQDADPTGAGLPLPGLPAFLENDLDWWLDPERRPVNVQTRTSTWRRVGTRFRRKPRAARRAHNRGELYRSPDSHFWLICYDPPK